MDAKQKQVIDSFVRVRSFIDAHPTTGPLSDTDARSTLDDVIQQLDEHAGAQVLGQEQSRAEARRQDDQIEAGSDVGLPAGLRMPRLPLGPTKVLAACAAMIEAARPFEALFVRKGLPADFLARFTAARDGRTRAGSPGSQLRPLHPFRRRFRWTRSRSR